MKRGVWSSGFDYGAPELTKGCERVRLVQNVTKLQITTTIILLLIIKIKCNVKKTTFF